MSDTSQNNKRIAKNTLILYIRMFFLMAIALYTSRVILNALGVEQYGVYDAVGGFIAMFGILSNSLSAAISRFITFELGKNDLGRLRQVFSCSLAMQAVIGLMIVVLAETLGVWFLNNKMVIPEPHLQAANWVLQFSILTFVFQLLRVPYHASVIAYEKMDVFAYISIFDAAGRLGIALLIAVADESHKLILYSGLLCAFSVFILLVYHIYTHNKLAGCRIGTRFDRSIVKSIFAFAGWNFIGASSGVLRKQGVNVLLNLFFGPVVNAARGIAMQVSSAVGQFSSSFTTALNPQITKQYANNNSSEYMNLVFRGSKFSVYLLLLVSIPVIFETRIILEIWLKLIPDYAVVFVQLAVVESIVVTISHPFVTLMLATGNIKNYQILVGGFNMLVFPVVYVILRLGSEPQYAAVVGISIELCCLVLRMMMLRRMVNLDVAGFVVKVLVRIVVVSALSCLVPLLVVTQMEQCFLRLLLNTLLTVVATGAIIFWVGCTKAERKAVSALARARLKSLTARHKG